MKFLVFGAALRKDSLNRKFAFQAAEILRKDPKNEVRFVEFREFEMPVYDGDAEDASGIPVGGEKLIAAIIAADAIVVSAPEYNGGISGALKNAIDWVSRAEKNPLKGKPLLLIGASPGGLGAVRGLWHTRVPFEVLGTLVYPEMYGLAKAHEAFTPDDLLKDEKAVARLTALLGDFSKFAD